MATTVLKPSLTPSRARFDLPIASLRPIRRDLGFQSRFQGVGVSRCFQKLHPIGYTKLKADRRTGVVSQVKDCASEVPDITKETWHAHVMECSTAVIVEFWAPWCGPCQVTHPIVAKLAKTYEGKLHCFKVNTDQCPDLSSQYGIRSIPTFIIFKDGEKKDAVIGAVPESTLVSFLEKTIGR